MKRRLLTVLSALMATAACGRLESLPTDPARTPEAWLASQPWVEFSVASRRILVVQPSTTLIVFALSILSLAIGARFLRTRDRQLSRFWWGAGLVLWGIGGLLAGTMVCIGLRALRWRLSRTGADLALLGTWLWLVLTTGAYYAYLVLDIPSALWARGIWFTENDVLHLGLIAWMFSIALVIAPRLRDAASEPNP